MTTPVVVWFDPGKTTGAAWYDIAADRFDSWQGGEDDLADMLRELIGVHGERLEVGYELYIQTPRPRPGSKAVHSNTAIAVINRLCEEHDIPQLKGQPSSARAFKSTVVFLRRLGWYTPGRRHANDAAAHLFRYLIKQHPVPENIRTRLPAGY